VSATRLFLIQFGAERVSKRLSLHQGAHHLYWEPLIGVVVETSQGWVLLDTGMSRAAHEDPENFAAYKAGCVGAPNFDTPWHLYPAPPDDGYNWVLGESPLEEGLATIGLKPTDLAMAAISHMHVDHSGGIPELSKAGIPIVIQQEELDFVRSGEVGTADGFFSRDWSNPETEWRVISGDTEIAPGVHVVSTPGHTPGHQSFRVDLPESGTWLFSGDAADLGQNFLDNVPCGSCQGGGDDGEQRARESLEKLISLGLDHQARIVPGHDQFVFNAARHPTGGHR
jgi:N-acyl homoserine lactone hydrolase